MIIRGMGAGAADLTITQAAAGAAKQLGSSSSSEIPTDAPLSCAQIIAAGADVSGTDCDTFSSHAAAYFSALPPWLLPLAAFSILALVIVPGGRRR